MNIRVSCYRVYVHDAISSIDGKELSAYIHYIHYLVVLEGHCVLIIHANCFLSGVVTFWQIFCCPGIDVHVDQYEGI